MESGWWKFVTNASTTENCHFASCVIHNEVAAVKPGAGLALSRAARTSGAGARSVRPLHCGNDPKSPFAAFFFRSWPFWAHGEIAVKRAASRYKDSSARQEVVPIATTARPSRLAATRASTVERFTLKRSECIS